MGNLNQFAGIGLAVYLIAVVYNGNQAKLIQFLTQQTVFIKWLIALFILVFLAKVTKSPVISGLVYIAIVAMMITAAGNNTLQTAANQINKILGA